VCSHPSKYPPDTQNASHLVVVVVIVVVVVVEVGKGGGEGVLWVSERNNAM